MGNLIVKRKNSFLEFGRKLNVYINGKRIGQVRNSETGLFEMKDGNHNLRIGFGKLLGMSNEIPITIKKSEPVYVLFQIPKIWLAIYIIFIVVAINIMVWNFKFYPISIILMIILLLLQSRFMCKVIEIKEIDKNE